MNPYPFKTFCERIDGLPARNVLTAVALERQTVGQDLALGRAQPSVDTASILTFCRFLEGASQGALTLDTILPTGQWEFYRKTFERLAAAGELPEEVRKDFDLAFPGRSRPAV